MPSATVRAIQRLSPSTTGKCTIGTARGAQLLTQLLAELGLVHRVHVGNEAGRR